MIKNKYQAVALCFLLLISSASCHLFGFGGCTDAHHNDDKFSKTTYSNRER